MKKDRNIYLKQMDRFLSYLKNLSEREVSALDNNNASIEFSVLYKNKDSENLFSKPALNINVNEVINHLNSLNNRDSGSKYLDGMELNRKGLEDIIRALDLPFTKKDNIERLKEKIIESTIGFRLRSEAIQQNN